MKRFPGAYALALSTAVLPALSATAHAEEVVVGYQQIVGPFLSAIADGRFDAALKDAGYDVEWRQFTSGGDISTALASGDVPVGVMGSTGIAAATTRGVDLQLFWILDDIGHSEQLVARNGTGIETPADLVGKTVGVPFVSTSHFHLLVGLQNVWGIDPREVKILNMQPPQIVAAWQRGDIDAAYVWPPALSEILKSGTAISNWPRSARPACRPSTVSWSTPASPRTTRSSWPPSPGCWPQPTRIMPIPARPGPRTARRYAASSR